MLKSKSPIGVVRVSKSDFSLTGAPDIADIEIGKFANFLKGSEPSLVPLNRVLEPELDKFVLGRLTTYSKV